MTLGSLVLVGMDLLGVNAVAVVSLASVVAAALLGGLALAFGLGVRALVSNLIGARYLSDDYQVGERIRIGAYTGVILEIFAVAVVLDVGYRPRPGQHPRQSLSGTTEHPARV